MRPGLRADRCSAGESGYVREAQAVAEFDLGAGRRSLTRSRIRAARPVRAAGAWIRRGRRMLERRARAGGRRPLGPRPTPGGPPAGRLRRPVAQRRARRRGSPPRRSGRRRALGSAHASGSPRRGCSQPRRPRRAGPPGQQHRQFGQRGRSRASGIVPGLEVLGDRVVCGRSLPDRQLCRRLQHQAGAEELVVARTAAEIDVVTRVRQGGLDVAGGKRQPAADVACRDRMKPDGSST